VSVRRQSPACSAGTAGFRFALNVELAGGIDPPYPTFLTWVIAGQRIHRSVTVEMICFRYIRATG
jgi:hypothetical protein